MLFIARERRGSVPPFSRGLKAVLGDVRRRHLCRQHGINEVSLYNYHSRYGRMEGFDARRLKTLENKNDKVKAAGKVDAGNAQTERVLGDQAY
jgi:hypothetical protein